MAVSVRPSTARGAVVAGEDGGEDRLARPVGAALGGDEDVDRRRRGPAGDAAVGEVEAGLGEAEEGEVLPGLGGHQRRLGAAAAAQQAGIEAGVALGVGRPRAPSTSLLRARSATSTPSRAAASERPRRKTCRPSAPVRVARPRSVTTNHWVARGLPVLAPRGRRRRGR